MTLAEGTIERPLAFPRREAPQEPGDAILAELILETHRVTGIMDQTGAQRRLGRRAVLPVTDAVVTQTALSIVRWE